MGPRLAALVASVIACACTDAGTLVVQARTDLLPGRELSAVDVEILDSSDAVVGRWTVEAGATRDWGRGVRVAEEAGLARDVDYRVRVRALDADGAVLVERPVRVRLDRALRVATVLLSRTCVGVGCAAGQACLAGACVGEACTEEDATECGPPACADASACRAPVAPCAAAECTASGACVAVPDHAACPAGEVCEVEVGCVPAECASITVGAPAPIGGPVNTDAEEWAPSLSADGRELFFQRMGARDFDLWIATRAEARGPFEAAAAIEELATGSSDFDPSISRDGKTLYFASGRTGSRRIFFAQRDGPGRPFGPPLEISLGLGGADVYGPEISSDELALLFMRDDGTTHARLYVARRARRGDAFGEPEPLLAADTFENAGWPGLAIDEHTMFFEEWEGPSPSERVRAATRATASGPFAPGPVVDVLGPGASDPDPSWDGRTLQLAIALSELEADLYEAPLTCAAP